MRANRHRVNELFALIHRTLNITEELEKQPRLAVFLNHKGGLGLIPRNEAAVVAVRVIHMWLGVEPPNVAIGDTVTIYKAPGQTQVHYPWHDDSDEREASSDRRDSERAGSAVEGEGIGEEKWVSPSEWFANYFKERPDII